MAQIDRLKKVFAEGLGVSRTVDFESLEYRGIEEWDSVAHMQLVSEIEDEFEIMLDTEDVIGMSSFGKAKEILWKYGVEL